MVDDVLVVDVRWSSDRAPRPDEVRASAFALLGTIAEHSTHIRQRTDGPHVIFEMATGTVAGETPFAAHGHLVRLRAASDTTPAS